jgi:hypothetical protein
VRQVWRLPDGLSVTGLHGDGPNAELVIDMPDDVQLTRVSWCGIPLELVEDFPSSGPGADDCPVAGRDYEVGE